MKKLQNGAALFFIASVAILAAISIMGVWDIFSTEVITKSFETLGLLAGVSVLIIVAGKFIDKGEAVVVSPVAEAQFVAPAVEPFSSIRHLTVGLLVTSVTLLALLGVMAIWEIMSGETLHKSIASICILTFSSLVIVITCLEREQHEILKKKISGGVIALMLLLAWIFATSVAGL